MRIPSELRHAAIEGHKAGQGWLPFLAQHGAAIREAEPINLAKYRKLRSRLLDLLTTGGDRQADRDHGRARWWVDDALQQLTLFDLKPNY